MYLLIFCILVTIITSTDDSAECGRHRKPWHQLTTHEQMLYVNGFKTLRSNGILDVFIETHHLSDTPLAFADVHYTAQFFMWHSYFLTEIESQIRALGDEYKCFALPYWDFTIDAGYGQANDMPIYNSLLGSDGDHENEHCVDDELWNRDEYKTTYLCSDTEISLGINCCLKRQHGLRGHIPSADTLSPHIYSYHRWMDFQEAVVKEHTYVHGYVAVHNYTHMYGHNAAEDPLFIMLHNFLMYIRAMRTTCYGYDKIINEIEQYQPYAFDPYESSYAADMKPFVDRPMDFTVLAEQEWAAASKEDITIRKIFDLQHFDISYELGTFYHLNPAIEKYCGDNMNETWFYNDGSYDYDNIPSHILERDMFLKQQFKQKRRNFYWTSVSFVITIIIIIAAIIKYNKLCLNHKKNILLNNKNRSQNSNYGSLL